MVRFAVALLSIFIISVHAHGQSGWEYFDNSPERLIGLLDLDDVVRGGCGPAPERAMARVFSAPTQTSPLVGTIHWREDDTSCGLVMREMAVVKK